MGSSKGYVGIFICCLIFISCRHYSASSESQLSDPQKEVLIKRRPDGTLSSVNQIDKNGWVHGIRVTYYSDGKSIYSKTTLIHGIKNGPFIRYYKNGQIFEHTAYENGKKHGLARKYYKNGNLLAQYEYSSGNVLPGLKEYDRKGILISGYPEIRFKEEDHLDARNRVDLRIYSVPKYSGIKYFLKQKSHGQDSRISLISENGSALTQHYVKPGDTLRKKIEILAEIQTKLGNIMVKDLSYDLSVSNSP